MEADFKLLGTEQVIQADALHDTRPKISNRLNREANTFQNSLCKPQRRLWKYIALQKN